MRLTILAALLLMPFQAMGEAWTVDKKASQILFTYVRGGEADQGKFHRFSGEGVFDPTLPDEAELEIRIESASIDLNDTLASAFATSAEWFDSKNHPLVVYKLTDLAPAGENLFSSTGTLTIRGRTHEIEAPLTLTFDEGRGVAQGDLRLDRTDYLLGVGPAAAFVTIGEEVVVSFTLQAVPVN